MNYILLIQKSEISVKFLSKFSILVKNIIWIAREIIP